MLHWLDFWGGGVHAVVTEVVSVDYVSQLGWESEELEWLAALACCYCTSGGGSG
jgi:hypothetical protein